MLVEFLLRKEVDNGLIEDLAFFIADQLQKILVGVGNSSIVVNTQNGEIYFFKQVAPA